jgi:hypothetical protein
MAHPFRDTFLDLHVCDPDAATYTTTRPVTVEACFAAKEQEKRAKYQAECDRWGVDFTPFVMSHDGALAPAAEQVLKEVARRWAAKPDGRRGGDYNRSVRWLRASLQVAALRYSSMCLRTSRFQWRSVDVTDGAALDYMLFRAAG